MNFLRNFVLVSCLLLSTQLFAQELYEDDTPILLRHELSFGFTMHTRGLGLICRRGVHVTANSKRMIELEAITMKHPKERKTKSSEEKSPYVFGKLNSLMLFRAGFGFQNVLYHKADRTGLEIRFNYSIGASIGIAKPVYLYVTKKSIRTNEHDSVAVERYVPDKIYQGDILGKAEFTYGLNQLQFYPGGYAKAGFSFEFGRSDRSLRSLEFGAAFDLYPKAIPIMAYTHNNPYYVSLYLSVFFGGKW